MVYCILAAGEGSRLAQEGMAVPKPMVEIDGKPMIGRLLDQMSQCDAEEILLVVNSRMSETIGFLKEYQKASDVPVRFIERSTPSSLHSFCELADMIKAKKFVMTTVDTIFRIADFRRYVEAFASNGTADAFMAVTSYVDDEKPLYIEVDKDMNITAFRDEKTEDCKYVSGGVYGLTHRAITVARKCLEAGQSRMRNFQRALIADGCEVKAWDFGKIIDVDHADDIIKANDFLAAHDEEASNDIKAVILDYGGTIDTPGVHWINVFLQAYRKYGIGLSKEEFKEAFAYTERSLAKKRQIFPGFTFHDTVLVKADLQIKRMIETGVLKAEDADGLEAKVAQYCYDYAKASIEDVRPTLQWLKERCKLGLVSNFYGNIQSVLLDFGLLDMFDSIIESSTIGVRKPDPRIYAIGVNALNQKPSETLIVGDSLSKDIEPALSLGCKAVWIKGSGWDDKAETNSQDVPTITNLNQLREILQPFGFL